MSICIVLIALMLVIAIFEAFGIALIYPLITIIGNSDWLQQHERIADILKIFKIDTHRKLILFSSLSLLLFYIFKNVLILFQGKLQVNFCLNNQRDYSKRFFSFYMKKPYLYYIETDISIVSRNILTSVTVVFSEILINSLQIITNFIVISVIWIFIFAIDRLVAIGIVFVMGPLVFFILNFFRKKITKFGKILFENNAKTGKWVAQGFYSIKETKVMQQEKYFIDEFSNTYSEYVDSNKDFLIIQRFPKAIIELFTIGGILSLISVKILIGADPTSLVPTLGMLALAAVRLMPCLNQMINMFNSIKFKFPLFNEIYDDLLIVRNNKDLEDAGKIADVVQNVSFEKEISVKNLSFAYPSKDSEVLSNVSFTIPKGAFVGIVGPSGAGKTTFVDILLGLLVPSSGTITVDGHDIYKELSGWLNNVAYVPQSICLIDSSIKENIAFGIPVEDIDNEQIEKVLKMAELYDFVQSLPEKENTNIGDRGAKLSGGQKQRIGIARALYQNPNVLVLDEATSALDNETEKHISDTILKLKGKITIISIAHRLSTLEKCDFKIEFKNGKAEKIS